MFIPIIVAATRPESNGWKVGLAIQKIITQTYPDIQTQLVSPNDFKLEFDSNDYHDPKFTELTANANAFIFVISEYNHSYPGRFKTLLDSEFKNYSGKFALLAGVSNGVFGGVRALEAILPVLRSLDIRTIRKDIPFREVQNLVNNDGDFTSEDQKKRTLDAIEHFLGVIKPA